MKRVDIELIINLIVIYGLFVVGDLVTTFWLITYFPGGIVGESNPIARGIYENYGFDGMIVFKIFFYLFFSTMTIYLYGRYGSIKWFKEFLETLLLMLAGISILTLINNFLAIISIYHLLLGGVPLWIIKILSISLSLVIVAIGSLVIFDEYIIAGFSLIGTASSLMPIVIWPYLEPLIFLSYIIVLYATILIFYYSYEGLTDSEGIKT